MGCVEVTSPVDEAGAAMSRSSGAGSVGDVDRVRSLMIAALAAASAAVDFASAAFAVAANVFHRTIMSM